MTAAEAKGRYDGGWSWLQESDGLLSRRDRVALLPRLALLHVDNAIGRTRLLLRRSPWRRAGSELAQPDLARLDLAGLAPPDTRWAAEAEDVARGQPPPLLAHAYRSWAYAVALARLDRADPDPELLYVSCLLHDLGLLSATPGVCFTRAGALAARSTGEHAAVDRARADRVADAIVMHLWPRLRVDPARPEAAYLQAGTLLDVVGLRVWDLPPEAVRGVLARWPRAGFAAELVPRWRVECAAVPQGRAEFLRRFGGLLLALRIAPFPAEAGSPEGRRVRPPRRVRRERGA